MLPVVATDLSRRYATDARRPGLGGALSHLLRLGSEQRIALDKVSFSLAPGELVGLIGPNGAGKSTTVKLLAGLLKPSGGRLVVGGLDPWADRPRHVRRVGAVMGQRTTLWWDLTVRRCFDLLEGLYEVPPDVARRLRGEAMDALGVDRLLDRPVRELSLGERVRCELVAALQHEPGLLLLDEPTVGLDVAVRLRLRAFLAHLRDDRRTTMVLATHDLADVAALCPRVLLLAGGRLLHDGPLGDLATRLGGARSLTVHLRSPPSAEALAALPGAVVDGATLRLAVGDDAAERVRDALACLDVADLALEDPPVEALVARFYEDRGP